MSMSGSGGGSGGGSGSGSGGAAQTVTVDPSQVPKTKGVVDAKDNDAVAAWLGITPPQQDS